MMVKILISILILLVPIFQIVRDWKFPDRRTKLYKYVTWVLILLSIALVPLTINQLWSEEKENKKNVSNIENISTTQSTVVTGQNQLHADNASLEIKSDSCYLINKRLVSEIQSYQDLLKKRNQEIEELKEEAKLAKEGNAVSYDLDGSRREIGAGTNTLVENTPESEAYLKLVELEKEHKFAEIIKMSNSLIKSKNKSWYAPYLFRGVAYANLGNVEKAKTDLEYVLKYNENSPNYQFVKDLLKQLKNRT